MNLSPRVQAPVRGAALGGAAWFLAAQLGAREALGSGDMIPVLGALLVGAALAFWFISKVNRVPLSVALARGFRGCAVPIACALLLAYAALLPITLRLESAADEGIRHSLHHEGRYLARIGGTEWPGRMP